MKKFLVLTLVTLLLSGCDRWLEYQRDQAAKKIARDVLKDPESLRMGKCEYIRKETIETISQEHAKRFPSKEPVYACEFSGKNSFGAYDGTSQLEVQFNKGSAKFDQAYTVGNGRNDWWEPVYVKF